ncbi:aspartate aminotransferase family protein, partial [Lysobacter sp. 2RAB21]
RHPQIGDVDGLGLALRAEICEDDGFTPSKKLLDRMADIGLAGELDHNGKKMGLVLDVGGYYKNVITLAPSLHITPQEIDLSLSLLD